MSSIDVWMQNSIGQVDYTSDGSQARTICPFCYDRVGSEDTKGHLYVSLEKPVAICHRCEWTGTYLQLIMSVDHCTYTEAFRHIAEPVITVSGYDKILQPRQIIVPYKGVRPDRFISFAESMPYDTNIESDVVWKYLVVTRRIPIDIVLDRCGYVPGSNRAWFLIDHNWWQGRSLIDAKPKYISPAWPREDALWNADALDRYTTVAVCEGVISAIAAGRNAVALCGKSMTEQQAQRLARSKVKKFIMMLDPDANDQNYVLCNKLAQAGYAGVLEIYHLVNGDPAEDMKGYAECIDWFSQARHRMSVIGI